MTETAQQRELTSEELGLMVKLVRYWRKWLVPGATGPNIRAQRSDNSACRAGQGGQC